MHKCLRCGKLISTMEEVETGCECGSKVFLFQNDGLSGEEETPDAKLSGNAPSSEPSQAPGLPESEQAPKFSDEQDAEWIEKEIVQKFSTGGHSVVLDLENVRMREKGVFELNLHSLISKQPIVVKDSNGIYYIKLP